MKKKTCYLIIFCVLVILLTACATNSDKKQDTVTSESETQKTTRSEKFGDINLEVPEEWTLSTDEESTSIQPDSTGDVTIIAFYDESAKSVELDLNLSTYAMGIANGEGVSDFVMSDTQLSEQPAKDLRYTQTLSGNVLNIHGYLFPVLDKLAYIAIAEKDGCTKNYNNEFEEMINNITLPQNAFVKE